MQFGKLLGIVDYAKIIMTCYKFRQLREELPKLYQACLFANSGHLGRNSQFKIQHAFFCMSHTPTQVGPVELPTTQELGAKLQPCFSQVRFNIARKMVFISSISNEEQVFYDCLVGNLDLWQTFLLSLWSFFVFVWSLFVCSQGL